MSKTMLSLFFLMSWYIQFTSQGKTSDTRNYSISKRPKSLYMMFNDIFKFLNLNDSFMKPLKIQRLLTMHKNLLEIVYSNNKETIAFNNITDKIPINEMHNVDEIMDEISSENCTIFSHDQGRLSYKITVEIFRQFKEFLWKIEKLKPKEDHQKTFSNPSTTYSRSRRRENRLRNLKKWIPSARRILRSKNPQINDYPFMASIHIASKFIGAGSIISKNLVITRAYSLQGLAKSGDMKRGVTNVAVRVGSDFTNRGGALIPISDIHFHPSYNPLTLKNNLAILRMKKNVNRFLQSKMKVRRIRYDATNVLNQKKSVRILGWEDTNEPNNLFKAHRLSYTYIDVYDWNYCKAVNSEFAVTDDNFCAGFKSKRSDSCNNNLGDVAVFGDALVGVVSFGTPLCPSSRSPAVFTRISKFYSWIDSVVMMVSKEATKVPEPMAKPVKSPNASIKLSLRNNDEINVLSNFLNLTDNQDIVYPDEIEILKDLLKEFNETDVSMVDEILEEGFKQEMLEEVEMTTKVDVAHHPLFNKSIILFYMSDSTSSEEQTEGLTPANLDDFLGVTPNFADKVPNEEDFEMYLKEITKSTTTTEKPATTPHPTPIMVTHYEKEIMRNRNPDYDQLYTDSISSNYENTDSNEGLSIDATSINTQELAKHGWQDQY